MRNTFFTNWQKDAREPVRDDGEAVHGVVLVEVVVVVVYRLRLLSSLLTYDNIMCLLRRQGKAPPDPALDKVALTFGHFPNSCWTI